MFTNEIIGIVNNIWPTLLLFAVIAISIRIAYLIKTKKSFVFYKEILALGFILYVLSLYYVVTYQDVSWSGSNFTFFKEIFRYEIGSKLFFKNVIGNMMMFLPYGFFIGYFLKEKKVWVPIILSLIASVTIEAIQYKIGRVFDVDDVILNVMGGIAGFYLFKFIFTIKNHLPDVLKKDIIYNILAGIVIILIIGYLFKILNVGESLWEVLVISIKQLKI